MTNSSSNNTDRTQNSSNALDNQVNKINHPDIISTPSSAPSVKHSNTTSSSSDTPPLVADLKTDAPLEVPTKPTDTTRHRVINTFMRRRTHVSKQAEEALSDPAYSKYIINSTNEHNEGILEGITDLRALFADTQQTPNGSDAPITLEIGFGMGGSLIEMAAADPTTNFVGIEVHEAGIGKCAYMAQKLNLNNIKIINGDAIELMQQLPNNHIDRIQLYFPDPWQKKRHYKRRFVNPERMQIVSDCLKPKGLFHTATDWEHYAFWMLNVLDNFHDLSNTAGRGNFTHRPDFRPMTKFEKRGLAQGHGVWDLIYSKNP